MEVKTEVKLEVIGEVKPALAGRQLYTCNGNVLAALAAITPLTSLTSLTPKTSET